MAEGIRVFLLLVNFRQEVCGEGPVFLHDAGRGLHATSLELVDQLLEVIEGLVVFRLEFLASDLLDGVGIVDQATSFDGDREAVGLAVNADGVVSVFDPILVRQVDGVLFSQGVDVLGIDHGDGVRILGCVLGGEMRCDGVVGVVDLNVHTLFLGVLRSHVFHLAFDFNLGVEDGDLGAAGTGRRSACSQHANGHQRCDDSGTRLLPRRELAHFPIPFYPLFTEQPCPMRC